ncbi:MAG: hypothetical protein IT379_19190, partial [Deltaproteobacteria bacterium]|nr:hypothetical protein [Deltaproteobacteria bacterium]
MEAGVGTWRASVVRRRRARALYAFACVALGAHLLAVLADVAHDIPWFPVTFCCGGVLPVLLAILVAERPRHGLLLVDREGARLRDARGRDERVGVVVSGLVLPRRHSAPARDPRVELDLADGRAVIVAIASEDEGDDLLLQVGLGPAQAIHRYRIEAAAYVPHALTALFLGFLVAVALAPKFAGADGRADGVVIALSVAVVGAVTAMLVRAPDVGIGLDGISVHGIVGRWFVSFDDIASVEWRQRWLLVVLRDGRKLRALDLARILDDETRSAIGRRVGDVVRERAHRPTARHVEVLTRGGRSLSVWLDALRAIGRSDPGYRDAAIGRPTLELVLDDPRAPVSARIGAAIAL